MLMGEDAIKYLLRDEFIAPLATGSVNGTAAEPGPGTRTVVDTGNNISLSGGKLVFANGTGTWGQTYLAEPALVGRVPGIIGIFDITPSQTNKFFQLGFGTLVTGYPDYMGVQFSTSAAIRFFGNHSGAVIPIVGSYVTATNYKVAIIQRSNGSFLFVKGGIYTNYTLLYSYNVGTTANLVPFYSSYDAAGNADLIRISTFRWLPPPLFYLTGAMTWPISDGYAGDGGLGVGGSGLTMLDAGTWSTAGGYVLNTPVAGVEKISDPGFAAAGDWTDSGVSFVVAGNIATGTLTSDTLTNTGGTAAGVGQWYKLYSDITLTAGTVSMTMGGVAGPAVAAAASPTHTVRATTTGKAILTGAGYTGTADNFSAKPLPISSLITNCQLSTTDVLAEQVIHARTPGTQVGMAMNLDRSFAAKAAATASAGQAVIALKEVTGVGGVGLAVTDSITVGGVTYTIASVTGGSNVAYDDSLKTQTITLGTNLGAQVNVDDKVGLDWAAWNGVLGPYFDGAGNVKLDEVVAGAYTNRISSAVTFVADKRLMPRKVGTEYRVFFNEVLLGTTSLVAAAAMAGKYCGLFSSYNLNTISSFICYDTGAVTNLYSNLDKYSN